MSAKIFQEQFSLLEQISCPIALVDEQLVLHFANVAFAESLGGALPVMGDLESILANTDSVRRSLMSAAAISSPIPIRLESVYENQALHGLISRVTYAGRTLFLVHGSQHDTNRFLKLNTQLESINTTLSRERHLARQHENTLHAIEAFVDVLVHDIRSPLATVVQGLDLLPEEIEADNLEFSRRLMDQLKQSSTRLVEFVDSLYEHSKVHRSQLEVESIDLATHMTYLQQDLASLLEECGGELILQTVLPVIKADRQLLRQLLQNLLQNAVKFRHPARKLTIMVGCERLDDSTLELFVRDNGQGFEPNLAKQLFDPYVRNQGSANSGMGIGLATCRSIAEKHDWSIRAIGKPNEGAEFRIRIPSHM
ncbi:sensor histidine kinase [Cerasicoccus frondis]|uniref:sensor histidine kinase n=1 Tax=Cerasicoccus frondis TaxID=490090 RepID=UPI002852A972|nr:HAMP domain-containing sensor histidine kinase [Cerasicoccus frondis]